MTFSLLDLEADRDRDENLLAFLKQCKEQYIHLNPEKMKLRQDEVLFTGHLASAKGLGVDHAKVRTITEMPPPSHELGVQRMLGLAQYLVKFLPNLSDMTKPLRDIT